MMARYVSFSMGFSPNNSEIAGRMFYQSVVVGFKKKTHF